MSDEEATLMQEWMDQTAKREMVVKGYDLPDPPDDYVPPTIRVVELTPELKRELGRLRLGYHIWRGMIVLEFHDHPRYKNEIRSYATRDTKLEAVRYLLSYDYEYALRAEQERVARG